MLTVKRIAAQAQAAKQLSQMNDSEKAALQAVVSAGNSLLSPKAKSHA